MTELNIVDLIEKNPITRLSAAYNNKLLSTIQETFTGFEQQLFVSSFYCYLNYDKNLDFVVDLDDVWKWLGFSQKIRAKEILEKNFNTDADYKVINEDSTSVSEQYSGTKTKQNGGQNRQIIMLLWRVTAESKKPIGERALGLVAA